jgi:hypothetical protein
MTALPTQTTPLTGEGAILGTLQYMALSGEPFVLADRVADGIARSTSDFSVSANGVLAWRTSSVLEPASRQVFARSTADCRLFPAKCGVSLRYKGFLVFHSEMNF